MSMQELPDNKLSFYFIPVIQYNELDITPLHILEEAHSKLQKYRNTSLYRADELLNMIKDAIDKSKNVDSKRVVEFFKMQKNYDMIRNQNLFQTKPHFIEFAKQFKVNTW
jgi:hypothetical protein